MIFTSGTMSLPRRSAGHYNVVLNNLATETFLVEAMAGETRVRCGNWDFTVSSLYVTALEYSLPSLPQRRSIILHL